MNILGICNANNSGAALIVDGKIIAIANEERFSRKKFTREFPVNAIDYVLKEGSLRLEDIDYLGCGAWNGIDTFETLPQFIDDISSKSLENSFTKQHVFNRFHSTLESDSNAKKLLVEGCMNYGINPDEIIYCDHHYSHALTAFYPSEYEDAVVLVADGRGDFRSISIWSASRENGLQCLHSVSELNSLGAMYSYITKLLGFIPDRHEGKVTGLAAHGKPHHLLEEFLSAITFNPENGGVDTNYGDFYLPYINADLKALEKLKDKVSNSDFAFAAQIILEDVLCKYLSFQLNKFFNNKKINLCLSGGCFANVKLNFELYKLKQVEKIYISPEMGDGGNAFGGAINCMIRFSEKKYLQMPNVYLGPSYNEKRILEYCNQHKLNASQPTNLLDLIAEKLKNSEIIGWFTGRMEYGPRALGARSILASPTDSSINTSLNKRLNRTEFMPFAPVTTDKLARLCFKDWKPTDVASRFMTTCYECTEFMNEKCPATVHIDNTARPQVVRREDNERYYDLITKFYELTGIPALINTSFNNHEEPIVCTPGDAMSSYLIGNVDLLVIDKFLITK